MRHQTFPKVSICGMQISGGLKCKKCRNRQNDYWNITRKFEFRYKFCLGNKWQFVTFESTAGFPISQALPQAECYST